MTTPNPKKPSKTLNKFKNSFSFIVDIDKNELVHNDVMTTTEKGKIIARKAVYIADALVEKMVFRQAEIYSGDPLSLYLRAETNESKTSKHQRLSIDDTKRLIAYVLSRFPYPELRANTMLENIYTQFQLNLEIIKPGQFRTVDD